MEQWLDERKGMSFSQLRIEAATAQLKYAKQHKANGERYANDAIALIEERLAELNSPHQE